MKDVFILASHRSLVHKAETIIAEEGLDRIDIFFCKTVEEVLRFVTEALPATAEVLLAMPGTTTLLEDVIGDKIPLLPIEYNNIDIIRALRRGVVLPVREASLSDTIGKRIPASGTYGKWPASRS